MRKRIGSFVIIMAMLCCLLGFGQTVQAATGKTSIAVTASTLNIGDSVTVTVRATTSGGGSALATMTLSYDAGILEFVSCSSSTYGGGGGSVTVPTDSFSVTLKAIAAGKSSLTVTASDGVDFETNEELESVEGSSTSITVNNAASGSSGNSSSGSTGTGGESGTTGNSSSGGESTPVLSADNSLKTLTISPGSLSPAFTGSHVNYTATVDYDVTSLAINAVPVNKNATVESVSGNTNLAVGTNDIKIVVKAENGTTATYTIKVTRLAENENAPETPAEEPEVLEETGEEILINNTSYRIAGEVPAEIIPADFTVATVNYHGTGYQGLTFDKGTVTLFYLVSTTGENGKLFVYDETRDTMYDFAKMNHGENYVIPLLPPVDYAAAEDYTQTTFQTADGSLVQAYQILSDDASAQEFYLFYGVNRDGTEGWYQYDSLEGTYQRASSLFTDSEEDTSGSSAYLQEQYAELSAKYKAERSFSRNVFAILGFAIAILVLIIINILVFGWRKLKGDDDDDNDDNGDDDFSDDLEPEKKRRVRKVREKEAPDADSRREEKNGKEAKRKQESRNQAETDNGQEAGGKKETTAKKDIDVIDFNDL